jgi:hypothetical protein
MPGNIPEAEFSTTFVVMDMVAPHCHPFLGGKGGGTSGKCNGPDHGRATFQTITTRTLYLAIDIIVPASWYIYDITTLQM